tara:strand:+ start:304 stop:870 length:567 start_codon:yes stop_codon:yes gene_type:complete
MEPNGKKVLRMLAKATIYRRADMIAWMNENGWSNLSPNSTLNNLNQDISQNIENKRFQEELAIFLDGGDPEYLNIAVLTVIGIIAGITAIIGGTVKAVQVTKAGRLARQLGMSQFRGTRAEYEYLKRAAEIERRREFITKLASEQQRILAEEEIELLKTEKSKRTTVIGLIMLGAIGVPLLYYFSIKK